MKKALLISLCLVGFLFDAAVLGLIFLIAWGVQ